MFVDPRRHSKLSDWLVLHRKKKNWVSGGRINEVRTLLLLPTTAYELEFVQLAAEVLQLAKFKPLASEKSLQQATFVQFADRVLSLTQFRSLATEKSLQQVTGHSWHFDAFVSFTAALARIIKQHSTHVTPNSTTAVRVSSALCLSLVVPGEIKWNCVRRYEPRKRT